MRARFAAVGTLVLILALLTTSVSASPPAHGSARVPARLGGAVRPHAVAIRAAAVASRRQPNLTYHGGPVMASSTTYAIFWAPTGFSFGTKYQNTIEQYFTDAAVDSGTTGNVYSVLEQYTDKDGNHAAYDQTYGGAYVDTKHYPPSGCPRYMHMPVCLTNKQLVDEVKRVKQVNGWTGGLTNAFFVFMPNRVGSCFNANGKICAFQYYCAYHTYYGKKADPSMFGSIPYAPRIAGCRTPQQPNGAVDGTLDSVSHEHREMLNDPLLNAWFDANKYEGSDKCAYDYGKPLGSAPNGQDYNQLINGHLYYVQREWSNDDHGCRAHA